MADAADSRAREQPPTVVLYKKERCPLCDEALEVLHSEAKRTPFLLTVQDITGEPELLAVYGSEVPVVFIDGRKRFFGHVDSMLLRRALGRR